MVYRLTITAELRQWHLDDEKRSVTGEIHNSTDTENYPNRIAYSVLNFQMMTHYPAFRSDTMDTEEHWLIKTRSGKYFILYRSQKK